MDSNVRVGDYAPLLDKSESESDEIFEMSTDSLKMKPRLTYTYPLIDKLLKYSVHKLPFEIGTF